MIVTRQRRKPFPWIRVLLPLVAIALVVVASLWAPSRNVIANGPLAPAWRAGTGAFGGIAQPFHFAAQNQAMTDLKHQIVQLQAQAATAKRASQAKDKRIADLQSSLTQLQAQAATARGSTPKSAPPSGGVSNGAVSGGMIGGASSGMTGGDLSAGATSDMHRTAQYWANMEPENAAKVVQRLPVAYVARVMSLMSADAAGSLLDALPAAYAAELTQEHPELRR